MSTSEKGHMEHSTRSAVRLPGTDCVYRLVRTGWSAI